jgi:hypothetical protein
MEKIKVLKEITLTVQPGTIAIIKNEHFANLKQLANYFEVVEATDDQPKKAPTKKAKK